MLDFSDYRKASSVFFPSERDRHDFAVHSVVRTYSEGRPYPRKSDFLLENMAFFFIPAGVSIINYFDVLKNWVVQLIVICVVSTVVTFAVTADSMKFVLYLMQKKKSGRAKE